VTLILVQAVRREHWIPSEGMRGVFGGLLAFYVLRPLQLFSFSGGVTSPNVLTKRLVRAIYLNSGPMHFSSLSKCFNCWARVPSSAFSFLR
jgi:hypothetical protein